MRSAHALLGTVGGVEAGDFGSSRLREIAESSDGMYKTCMVYDEDGCRISADLLNVAKSRVNHVLPCQREDELEDILKASVA